MGVDAHSAALNAVNWPAIHRRPPMIFNLKKTFHCTDDVTYHVTSPLQCNGLFRNKCWYGMGFRIRSTSIQYTTRPLLHYTEPRLLHCTVLTTLQHHYTTALYSLHCATTTPRSVLTALLHHCYTALYSTALCSLLHCTTTPLIHCTALIALHCAHYTDPPLLYCTALTLLYAQILI